MMRCTTDTSRADARRPFEPIFARLESELPPLLAAVLERQASCPKPVQPLGPFAPERQKALGLKLMSLAGFDFEHGRLDEAPHPFCGGVTEDLRLTTRYEEASFVSGLMGVMHETGHALYEQGLPLAWRNQPVGDARGMSLHESQSLLMEMQACRSRGIVEFIAPLAREAFSQSGPAFEAENLYRLYTWVAPGYIRVDADEVTLSSAHPAAHSARAGDDRGRARRLRPATGLERGLPEADWP
jgi:carboxypeptidase Taq